MRIGTDDAPVQECPVCYCVCADKRALNMHIRWHESISRALVTLKGE